MKHPVVSTITTTLSGVTAIAAWQEQLDWGLRIAASCIAIVAGLFAIHDWLKRRRARRSS